ncbi:MAG: right-handed parallel beta-helix repeat-containing protein, partial [bacterium]
MKFTISIGLLFLMLSVSASAATIEVPATRPTVQAGIDAAANGDTVLVAPGVYYENVCFRGKEIVLTSYFALDHDPAFIETTILDGSQPAHPDTGSVVRIVDGEGPNTILQGFTIRNGSGTIWTDEHDAGDFREGGAILCQLSSPLIAHNHIIDNIVNDGTGVVSTGGGGIRTGDGAPRIVNNLFRGNYGAYGAAIVLNYCGEVLIRNNVIVFNENGGDYNGGALWAYSSSPAIVENCVIYGNLGVDGLVGGITARIRMRNSIVWSNTGVQVRNASVVDLRYCDIMGGYDGTEIVDVDPLFGDTLDFYLAANSPLIDVGDPSSYYDDVEDSTNPGLALFPALGTVRNDMGAYGGHFRHNDFDGDGVVNSVDNC